MSDRAAREDPRGAYSVKETLKQRAWSVLADALQSDEERKCALLTVIAMHYIRMTESEVPSLDAYIGHWLVANGGWLKEQDITSMLRKDFPAPLHPKLAAGRTYLSDPQGWRQKP